MPYEEKGAWVYLVTSAGAYLAYLVIIIGRLQDAPAAQVSYAWALLWTTLAAMAGATVGRTLLETASRNESRRIDVRDKEIYRFGEYVSAGSSWGAQRRRLPWPSRSGTTSGSRT